MKRVGTSSRALNQRVAVSALNAQELTKKIVERGGTREDAARIIADLAPDVRDLTLALAIEAGAPVTLTRLEGLSEGDRACLALPRLLGVPAVTADRPWAEIADALGGARGIGPIGRPYASS